MFQRPTIGVAADVRDVEATGGALAAAHDAFGDIDVLVSGAAGNFPAPALGMSPNAFRSVLEIDLLGTYHALRTGCEFLRKPGSVVINISAPQAFLSRASQSHVCAAKAGVDMQTRVLAIEWGPALASWSPARSREPREWPAWLRRRTPRPQCPPSSPLPTDVCGNSGANSRTAW